MGYGLVSNWIGTPMTSDRVDGIQKVLTDHGVSDVGAEQIIQSKIVTNSSDRQKLLELLNKVVAYYPDARPRGRR